MAAKFQHPMPSAQLQDFASDIEFVYEEWMKTSKAKL